MATILSSMSVVATLLLAFLATPGPVAAQDHPQEVLDLIAQHEALAMKIRPLHDRVIVRRSTKDSKSSESRVPERLRHKNRAAASSDEYGRVKVKMITLDKKARAERERVNRPNFGVGLRGVKAAKKKLAALQREYTALSRELAALERVQEKTGWCARYLAAPNNKIARPRHFDTSTTPCVIHRGAYLRCRRCHHATPDAVAGL